MRVSKAISEMEYQSQFDRIITNDDLDKALNEVYKEIDAFL